MKPSNTILALQHLVNAKRPAFVWGAPGIGKSDIIRNVAKNLDFDLIDVRASQLDPVDLRGLPSIVNGQTVFNAPDFLPDSGKGILFLDELNSAPPMVQAAMYQLILDRRIGNYQLPNDWAIIAAGNRAQDRAIVNRMPSALANRLVHVDLDVDLGDWNKWAINNLGNPEIVAFVNFRPELLHAFDASQNPRCFPSPRTWAFVDQLMTQKPDPEIEYDLYAGTVGEGAAAELIGFLKVYRELPNIDSVLMNPESTRVPTDAAAQYAVSAAIARKTSEQTFGNALKYLARLPSEFSVLAVKLTTQRCQQLTHTSAYTSWCVNNADVL